MEMEKRRVSRLKIKKLKLSELPVVSVEAGNSAGVSSDGESAVTAKGAGAGAKPEEKDVYKRQPHYERRAKK